jgi:hypothetical protein
LPGDPGYHLHAAKLTFRHPGTMRDVVIECEPPSILQLSTGARYNRRSGAAFA